MWRHQTSSARCQRQRCFVRNRAKELARERKTFAVTTQRLRSVYPYQFGMIAMRFDNFRVISVWAALTLSISALPAHAATQLFDWTLTSPGPDGFNASPITGSGTLTATEETGGAWLVTAATGTVTDIYIPSFVYSVTGPATPSQNVLSTTNDNLIFPAGSFLVDGNGLGFATTDGGASMDIVLENGQYEVTAANLGIGAGGFTLTAVPEPATWAMMLIGFGGLGAMLRKGRQARTRDMLAQSA
jgi:hypothetical protein